VAATAGPYAWDPHLIAWAVVVVGGAAVVVGHRRIERSSEHPIPWTRRQMWSFGGAWVTTAVALTWPLGSVAAHWSLTALVVQRLLLILVVAPLLVLGLPYDLIQWLTRPRAVDAVLLRLLRPPVAIPVVTVLVVGSMIPALVRAQASSPVARGLLDLALLAAGLILWLPVLGRIPGIPRLKPVVRFGYLVAQAVAPAFLSFIYIFSNHPLYPVFARSHAAVGLRPLNDQQIAGFVSKLSMLFVLLIVGAVVLSRAPRSDEELVSDEPLVWADVERQFERVDRSGGRPRSAGPGRFASLRPTRPDSPASTPTPTPTPTSGPGPGPAGADAGDEPRRRWSDGFGRDGGSGRDGRNRRDGGDGASGRAGGPGRDLTDHRHGTGDSPEGDGPDPT
jgi:putative membrane protein